jgi:hypothetical protein
MSKALPPGTLSAILKQVAAHLGIRPDDLAAALFG